MVWISLYLAGLSLSRKLLRSESEFNLKYLIIVYAFHHVRFPFISCKKNAKNSNKHTLKSVVYSAVQYRHRRRYLLQILLPRHHLWWYFYVMWLDWPEIDLGDRWRSFRSDIPWTFLNYFSTISFLFFYFRCWYLYTFTILMHQQMVVITCWKSKKRTHTLFKRNAN